MTRPDFFDLLAGTDKLRKIEVRAPEAEVRASWAADLEEYRAMREQYILYPTSR